MDSDKFRKRPYTENEQRYEVACRRRREATDYAASYAAAPTRTNEDESELEADGFGSSFTKGLPHDEFAQLKDPDDYITFVNRINEQDAQSFDDVPRGITATASAASQRVGAAGQAPEPIVWRGWESPRAGHYFDLQGPDADAVSMPPAPSLGSEELIAEMAEVYALALLRDVHFDDIENASGSDVSTGISVSDVLNAMGELSWFTNHYHMIKKILFFGIES